MAIITDPDFLIDGQEIVISTSNKTVQLVIGGNLSSDGATIKCVYSKLKELWKNSATYIKFPFPMGPITDEQFEMINGWDWADDTTRYLLRTGGWAVKDSSGISLEEWACIVSLGVIAAGDQAYYVQTDSENPSALDPSYEVGLIQDFELTGPVNQAVKIYGDVTHGNFDYRDYFKIYCRIYQKTYAFSQLSEIGVSEMTYQAYRFPLANASDVKITHDDTVVGNDAPYSGMSITWYSTPQERVIGSTSYYFNIIVDGNNATAEQIFEFVQYKLRQDADIDDGGGFLQIGKKVRSLLRMVGDTLYTSRIAEGGVFIDNYQDVDVNRLVFTDNSGVEVSFPYSAVLTLSFGDNLINDTNAKYWVYFTNDDAGDNTGRDYGTSTAILVKDNDGVDMTDDVSARSSVQLTYAYDSNVQRGNSSAAEDAPITCVAIGLDTGQFVKATGIIARSTSNSVSLVAPLERNYQNN